MPDSQTDIPVIPLTSLPVYTGTLASTASLVAVMDNFRTVRIPWESVSAGSPSLVPVPSGAFDSGTSGSIAIGSDAVYTWKDGWGKTPRYTSNWGDIDADTRFMLVNKRMTLTSAEIDNVRGSIRLGRATAATLGLVRQGASTSSEAAVLVASDGTMTVRYATDTVPGTVTIGGSSSMSAATHGYVDSLKVFIDDAITQFRIPVPTETTLGGIKADPNGTFVIDVTGTASVPIAREGSGSHGLVMLSAREAGTATDLDKAASVGRVLNEVAVGLTGVYAYYADSAHAGMVIPTGALYIAGAEGEIDARAATSAVYGTVFTVDSVDEVSAGGSDGAGVQFRTVPTASAVRDYVDNAVTESLSSLTIDASRLPVADSQGGMGIISVKPRGAGGTGSLTIDAGGTLDVVAATPSQAGVVRTVRASTSDTSMPAAVPSIARVEEYVTERLKDVAFPSGPAYYTHTLPVSPGSDEWAVPPQYLDEGNTIIIDARQLQSRHLPLAQLFPAQDVDEPFTVRVVILERSEASKLIVSGGPDCAVSQVLTAGSYVSGDGFAGHYTWIPDVGMGFADLTPLNH